MIFWLNQIKVYTKSEGLGVVNSIDLQVRRYIARNQEVYSMETKLEYLLDTVNVLNMFEIQNIGINYIRKMSTCILKYTA